MTEQSIRDLGFEQEHYVDQNENGFVDRYYYSHDIANGFGFISCADDESVDGEWYVDFFDSDPTIRFTDASELETLINLIKSRIVNETNKI